MPNEIIWYLFGFLFACLSLYVFLTTRYFTQETKPDEIHFAESACRPQDGCLEEKTVRLALHRYRPQEKRYREPVIMCHGLAMNRFLFDFGGQPSFARYLRDQGFDAWIVECRGAGMSEHARLFHPGGDWTLDSTIQSDVSTFLETVARVSGGPVHWVGHSTGSVVILCHLCDHPDAAVASMALLGTPGHFQSLSKLGFLFRILQTMDQTRVLRIEQFSRLVAALWLTFYIWPVRAMVKAVVNPKNLYRHTLRHSLVNLITNPCKKLLLQYGSWIRTGRTLTWDQNRTYYTNLHEIENPVLLAAGSVDQGAPPEVAEWYREQLTGSSETATHTFGRETGCKVDYGHGDLMFGKEAENEVFPFLARWLVQHSTPLRRHGRTTAPS